MGAFKKYFVDLSEGVSSTITGLGLTLKHLVNARKKVQPLGVNSDNYFIQDTGIVTLEYPYEAIPVPDNGRYRLHNEIDDCIVCDKCAKVCPVDCIDIVAIKSTEEIGLTSDGSSKRLYAATFDIDMAKCCYCGLCTTVCPTECLTMTPTFDYSEFDVREMNYHFTDLSPEQAEEKQKLYEQKQAEKAAAKMQSSLVSEQPSVMGDQPKPVFKPKFPAIKPVATIISSQLQESSEPLSVANVVPIVNDEQIQPLMNEGEQNVKPKAVFKPKMPVPKIPTVQSSGNNEQLSVSREQQPVSSSDTIPEVETPLINNEEQQDVKPKVVFKPKMLVPKIPPKNPDSSPQSTEN